MSARKKLAALPGTSREIAVFLYDMGIQGVPGDARHCPLGRYLGAGWIVGVDGETYNFWMFLFPRTLKLSRAAANFVRDFDSDMYPELIRDDR